jgi:hypothetical protein
MLSLYHPYPSGRLPLYRLYEWWSVLPAHDVAKGHVSTPEEVPLYTPSHTNFREHTFYVVVCIESRNVFCAGCLLAHAWRKSVAPCESASRRTLDGVPEAPVSLLDPPEGVSEMLGCVGCCSEILLVHRGLELFEHGVDAGDIGTAQLVHDPVPDVVEGEEISVDRSCVAGRELLRGRE